MLDFQERGLGTNKGISTLFIASTSFDNIIAITGNSVMIGVVFNQGQLWWNLVKVPIQIIIGILLGVIFGCLLNLVRLSHSVSVLLHLFEKLFFFFFFFLLKAQCCNFKIHSNNLNFFSLVVWITIIWFFKYFLVFEFL